MPQAIHPRPERSYHQALTVAKLQSAKLLELQASISLTRLWCKQNRHGEARDLLAPIYRWFTEGFDAHDFEGGQVAVEAAARLTARFRSGLLGAVAVFAA